MSNFWRSIPNGTRALVLISVLGFLVSLVARLTTGIDLRDAISLNGSTVAGFQLWRLVTYALIPGDPLGAFFGTLFLIFLGPGIEQRWSPTFFIVYFLTCAAASGLVLLWILGSSPVGLLTNSGALLGLLVAWFQIQRFQRFLLFGGPEVSAATAAIVTALFIVLPVAFGCGWIFTPGIVVGAAAGWLFLRLRTSLGDRHVQRENHRTRASRLEL